MSWPQQIAKPKIYGNFRKRGKPEKKKNSKFREQRPGMSEDHLKLIRKCPCCVCPTYPAGQVHHLKQTGANERAMGVRSTDRWGVPLCLIHHDLVERVGSRREVAWFEEFKLDPYELARSLWESTGDLGKMIKIIQAHKSQSSGSRSSTETP